MASREAVVYICGESGMAGGYSPENSGTLRELLLAELAASWSTRTHESSTKSDGGQWQTTADRFHIISRSHVFVFIYSKKSISESFYLEQYGAAKSHCVPVIGVRLTNYFMPSHLPEQYYSTEIVSCTGTNKRKETLADTLMSDFKSAMVYAQDFHKSCVERLRNKIAHVCSKKLRENHFFAAMKEKTPENDSPSRVAVKCPKCGFFVRSATPKLQRASSTGALFRRSDETEPSSCPRKLTTSARRRKQNQPTTIQIPSPFITKKVALFTKTANENLKPGLEPVKGPTKASMAVTSERQADEKVEGAPKGSETEKLKSLRRQSRVVGNTWTDKLKSKLRRQSSLPVIPTTYLVTTPDGLEKQVALVKYPPEKSSAPPSPRGSDVFPIFSEDEELEIIHISRAPSPDVPST